MRILTANAGSTSVKLERYDLDAPLPELASPPAPNWAMPATVETLQQVLTDALRAGVDTVTHRFVRLPDDAPAVMRLDADAVREIARVGEEAPLHDAAALRGVALVRQISPATPKLSLPMATRSGSVDRGLLLHLLREGTAPHELENMLERHSGLLGISGRSGDVRTLLAAREDPDARLALDVLGWRLRAAIGAMIGVLGAIDLLVFTGGIGEHAAEVRAAGALGAAASGAELDAPRNAAATGDGRISTDRSRVGVFVVSAREGWQLARQAALSPALRG